ncbi:LacI family DNA-binding transcriptional regulator [Mucilaginibacter sp. FT3.2]|uniref:LacI family DNA-binding transcriptional regulator n=1 Tax=Mucilaginibacter sp. FT3.2 TaxID=2723090 RepID=UPI00161FA3F6|nr:LacI family DNA-binding transcriptional regulator [Mucilaginibacter sp. FT3.2]MBB6231919.1 LacI family transcriptional regulator [Mucilaginibacter sp. FT3.2]
MKKKVSIKDIAAHLNISITTVSLILNGKSKEVGLSDILNEKVLKYTKEIGYKPNLLAKSLRTGKTKIICLLVENIADPFFSSIAGFVEELATQRGYKIIYGSTKNDPAKTSELISLFKDRHVDGFIIAPTEELEADINNLLSEHVPLVLFDRYYPAIDTDQVVVDNFDSTYKAIQMLIAQGYKNIAFVTLESDQSQMHDRLGGYLKVMEVHGLTPCVQKIAYESVEQDACTLIKQLLSTDIPVDALFFGTNYLTLKGLEVLKDLDIAVPRDIGVISFDDHEVFKLFTPGITAVVQPVALMSEKIVELLLEQIDHKADVRQKKKIVVPGFLNVRNSTGQKK